MIRRWKGYISAVVFVATVSSTTLSAAQPEILTVDQLRPGMQGIARTVISGTEISEFGVEVLGIMKNKGPAGDLILVRTYGDAVERTGIAQGMSGSPVYVDGRLIGAIAYGWSLTDHKIGMVTPIADMLALWNLPARQALPQPVIGPVKTQGTEEQPGGDADNGQDLDEMLPPEAMQRPAAGTMLMTSGFSQHSLEMLRSKLQPFRLQPVAVGEVPAGVAFGPLQPGSAVGVQLVRGDVSVGALGTVTYVEGDKVLAFGHPFLKKGNIGFFMTNAYVFTTVNSLENSFKVGSVGDSIGTIDQDRGAAVAGTLQRYPAVVPFRVQVQDKDLQRTQEAAFQVVKDEELTPALAVTSTFNVIEKTMDRLGPGTAKVRFSVAAKELPGQEFSRENMFYSPANIGELAVGEAYEFMAMLASNQYQAVDIADVRVSVTVEESRRTAAIVEARVAAKTVQAGETLGVQVKFQPFRGEAQTVTVPFTIPKDRKPGPITLEVRGGGMVPLMQLLLRQQGMDENLFTKERRKAKDFTENIKDWKERDRNDEIIVEIMDIPEGDLTGAGDFGKKGSVKAGKTGAKQAVDFANLQGQAKETKETPVKTTMLAPGRSKVKGRLTTEYIIDRDVQLTLEIIGEKGKIKPQVKEVVSSPVQPPPPSWR